jgi:hypothetical protein
MTIKQLGNIFILIIILHSCFSKPTDSNKYFGVKIKSYGPTGSVYTDTVGKQFGFRSIMFEITNDTLIPVSLQIKLPNEFIDLKPLTDNKYKVFLLPDTMTRDKQYDFLTDNHQVKTTLEKFLNKELYSTTLKKVIQPKETYKLRLGFLFNSSGVVRAELFSKGHQHDLSIPEKEILSNSNNAGIDLIIGVYYNVPGKRCYSLVPCGQLFYSN